MLLLHLSSCQNKSIDNLNEMIGLDDYPPQGKSSSKVCLGGDMFVPRMVTKTKVQIPWVASFCDKNRINFLALQISEVIFFLDFGSKGLD